MDAVKKDVEALVGKELEAANKKFPLFHSAHEGYGVLLEEIGELKDEIRDIKEHKKLMKEAIHKNNDRMVFEYAEIMGYRAICAAVEAIQVAAMCEKFKMSLGDLWAIDHIPTADVAPIVHGRIIWKERHRGGFRERKCLSDCGNSVFVPLCKHIAKIDERYTIKEPYCSECGKLLGDFLNYCGNCGSKMKMGGEDNG